MTSWTSRSVPASRPDCRLISIESNSFSVDQAVLTGESESVGKDPRAVIKDDKAVLQDQINMLFSGTTVVTGHARAVVTLTGSNTAIGDIHESITAQISEPTPLKQKLNDFGDQLAQGHHRNLYPGLADQHPSLQRSDPRQPDQGCHLLPQDRRFSRCRSHPRRSRRRHYYLPGPGHPKDGRQECRGSKLAIRGDRLAAAVLSAQTRPAP